MAKSDNSPVNIKYSCKNGEGKYVISYSSKVDKLGPHLIANVVNCTPVIINVDTSLSFMEKKVLKEHIVNLKDSLQSLNISCNNRNIKSNRSEMNGLAQFFLYGKISGDSEVITFQLDRGFCDNNLFSLISYHGCEVFAAEEISAEMVQDVFNNNYQDKEKRLSSFKYVLYINDYINQSALYTKTLSMQDVEKLCFY